jgi:hypothetical protein
MDITDPVVWGSALSILFMLGMGVFFFLMAKKNMDKDSHKDR